MFLQRCTILVCCVLRLLASLISTHKERVTKEPKSAFKFSLHTIIRGTCVKANVLQVPPQVSSSFGLASVVLSVSLSATMCLCFGMNTSFHVTSQSKSTQLWHKL